MCGRFTHEYNWADIYEYYNLIDGEATELAASWNTAPTQRTGVVIDSPEGPRYTTMRWGLVPGWAKDVSIGARLINARAETAAEKPAFRSAFRNRRCVVPVSGFYEWRHSKASKSKQAYYITMAARTGASNVPAIMSLGGLWERWKAGDGSEILSFTIITTTANPLVAGIHDRMPVILGRAESLEWLRAPTPALLRPCPNEWLRYWPVSPRVNSPRNDDGQLIQPVEEAAG